MSTLNNHSTESDSQTGYEVSDADYQKTPHTAESFHSDGADIILADTVEDNDRLRMDVGNGLYWLDRVLHGPRTSKKTDPMDVDRIRYLNEHALQIGMRILFNAQANGHDANSLGIKE